jgi:hypothetical protein
MHVWLAEIQPATNGGTYSQNFVKALRSNQRLPTGTFPRSLLEHLPAKLFHGAKISKEILMGYHLSVWNFSHFTLKGKQYILPAKPKYI